MGGHASLKIELDLTERLAGPVQDRLDAIIRIGQLTYIALIANKLADQMRLVVAAPDYLARSGTPGCIQDLRGHRLLDKMHGADHPGMGRPPGRPGWSF
jgi:DNA-binding transcriptional LysR family regulator